MAKRTIKTALATYRSADGVGGSYGFRGEEVDIHADDVKRFDELNVQPGGDDDPDEGRVAVSMVSPGAGAETSGTGSGLNTSVTEDDAAESTAGDDAEGDKPARRSRSK